MSLPEVQSHSPRSEYTLRRRVAFYEVDSAGIVHFSWYFRYMEEAEHALWRAAGLTIAPADVSYSFPRVSASFDYARPLRFEDEFDITIRVVAIGQKSLRYSCLLRRGDERIAEGSLVIVCANRLPNQTMTSIPLPREIVERFAVAAPEL